MNKPQHDTTLAGTAARLRASIAWLRDGAPTQIGGIGVADMVAMLPIVERAITSTSVTVAAGEPARLLAPQPAPARDVVPGKVRCAKCAFSLQRVNLYLASGTTGPGGEEVEPCPNDGSPLLPVSWEQEAREAWSIAEQQFERSKALEAALAELVACKDLKDEEARRRQRRECSPMRRPNPALDEVNAMRDDYNRRNPLAWAAARALLPRQPPATRNAAE